MSDQMLLGVLRAPAPHPDHPLGIIQLVDRARQAADLIESQAKEIEQLRAYNDEHQSLAGLQEMEIEKLESQLESGMNGKSMLPTELLNRMKAVVDAAEKWRQELGPIDGTMKAWLELGEALAAYKEST